MATVPDPPKFTIGLLLIAIAASIFGLTLVCITMYFAYVGELSILKAFGVEKDPESMKTFSDKLEFTIKYWIFGLIWLYFYIHVVIMKRITSGALVPNTTVEYRVANAKSILTNSFEQMFVSLLAQSVAIVYLTPAQVINVIPLANILFYIGRIAFWLGYPKFRTLGVVVTGAPNSLLIWFSIYCVAKEHNLLSPVIKDLFPSSMR